MKKLFIISVIVMLSTMAFGQTKQDSIMVYSYLITFDKGLKQGQCTIKQDGEFIVDENNNKIIFDSPAKGLNHMIRQGWTYVDWEFRVSAQDCFLIRRKEPVKKESNP